MKHQLNPKFTILKVSESHLMPIMLALVSIIHQANSSAFNKSISIRMCHSSQFLGKYTLISYPQLCNRSEKISWDRGKAIKHWILHNTSIHHLNVLERNPQYVKLVRAEGLNYFQCLITLRLRKILIE